VQRHPRRIPREGQDDSEDGFLQAGVSAALVHEGREPWGLVHAAEIVGLATVTDHDRGQF
jgi:hypothetical protein